MLHPWLGAVGVSSYTTYVVVHTRYTLPTTGVLPLQYQNSTTFGLAVCGFLATRHSATHGETGRAVMVLG